MNKIYKNSEYTVRAMVNDNGNHQYYIIYHHCDASVEVEIDASLYELYLKEFRRPMEKQRNERRRHIDSISLDDEDVEVQGYDPFQELDLQLDLELALKMLTPLQKQYLLMNRLEGYSIAEIARIDMKNESAIRKSIRAAEVKINNYFSH